MNPLAPFASLLIAADGGGGFDPFHPAGGAAFWTWVCFLLALPFLWKVVFGPMTAALVARDAKVEDAIKAAEEARRQAEAQTEATRAELEKARQEAREMVAQATARAERQAEEALAKAKAEAERQLAVAREEIEAQKSKALLEIRSEVVGLAIGAAGKILRHDVDDEAHQRMVAEFMESAGG